jgi:hypothetical protein
VSVRALALEFARFPDGAFLSSRRRRGSADARCGRRRRAAARHQ